MGNAARDRQRGKFVGALLRRLGGGRRRRTPKAGARPSKYRKPSLDERLAIWRLTARGASARKAARILGRDHHTVRRHLQHDWGGDLALGLALALRSRQAWEMVDRLRDRDLAYEVGVAIEAMRDWRLEEALELAQLTLDVTAADSLAFREPQPEAT